MDVQGVITAAVPLLPDLIKLIGVVADLCRRSGATDEQIQEAVTAQAKAEILRIDEREREDEEDETAGFPDESTR